MRQSVKTRVKRRVQIQKVLIDFLEKPNGNRDFQLTSFLRHFLHFVSPKNNLQRIEIIAKVDKKLFSYLKVRIVGFSFFSKYSSMGVGIKFENQDDFFEVILRKFERKHVIIAF